MLVFVRCLTIIKAILVAKRRFVLTQACLRVFPVISDSDSYLSHCLFVMTAGWWRTATIALVVISIYSDIAILQ
jgi:hypothetical protein